MVCVGVQASVHSPPIKLVWIVFPVVYNHRFRHVLIVDPCLRKHISLQPCVSNTSGLCPVSVFKHLSSAPVIKHVWFGAPCCVQVSISIRASTHFVVPGLCTSSVYSPLSQTRLIWESHLCKFKLAAIDLVTVNGLWTKFSDGSTFVTVNRGLRSNFTLV